MSPPPVIDTPDDSPDLLARPPARGVGVRRLNRVPLFIVIGLTCAVLLLLVYTASMRSRSNMATGMSDDPATKANELVAIQYGLFLNTLIKFLIVAWVVFLLVKAVNVIRRREAEKGPPETPPAAPPQESLLAEIRDLLKAQAEKD